MPTLHVSKSEWWKIVEAARLRAGKPLPAYVAVMHYYNVCLLSIVTPLSLKLWQLYQSIRGTRNETYQSFYNLPAFWTDACQLIETEITRIDKVKADKAKLEQNDLLRKIGK
jgi:hypothetical protein